MLEAERRREAEEAKRKPAEPLSESDHAFMARIVGWQYARGPAEGPPENQRRTAVLTRFVHYPLAEQVWRAVLPALEVKRLQRPWFSPQAFMWLVLDDLERAGRAIPGGSKQRAQGLVRLAEQAEALRQALIENPHACEQLRAPSVVEPLDGPPELAQTLVFIPDDLARLAERLRESAAMDEPLVKKDGPEAFKVAFCRLMAKTVEELFGSPRWDVLAAICSLGLDMELGADDVRPLVKGGRKVAK